MSAQPKDTAPPVEMVELEVDGHPVKAPKGSMIIQATDAAKIPVPRFCYHEKLPIAANCRQCMVEVEMGGKLVPKPQPACATPVAAGMKVFTRSPNAMKWQRNTMEFLLINHPLDCPICDQGGECELQDISMGYGRSVTRFTERKRTISDENIGPLVATEMTRCIHCTRCVRFVGEIAGTHELGDMSRGDRHVIGTYIGRTIESELSGNVIDVCPVGALTDKVYQFKARAWEMIAKPSIGYHDALGSNLWLHTKRGKTLRVVPRDNEAINECWLADRDRYSHEGLYADDRADKPLIRKGGELVAVEWDEAIAFVAAGLKQAGSHVGALLAPMTSCEEGALLAQLLRGLGSEHIEHRLRIQDLSDGGPAGQNFEMPVEQVQDVAAALVIGCNPRSEMPLLNHRLRHASRHDAARHAVSNPAHYDVSEVHGARIFALNPVHFDGNFDLAGDKAFAPQDFVDALLITAKAAGVTSDDPALAAAIAAADDKDDAREWAAALREAKSSVVILGAAATEHPQAAWLRALARAIAKATGSAFNELPSGANAVGLARVGAQSAGGVKAVLEHAPKALITWQTGSQDTYAPSAYEHARKSADFYVYAGAYACEGVRATANAVLPLGLPPEIDGTYVNVDGVVQAVAAGSALPGDARPGWKVLRALGAALGVAGFDFVELGDLHKQIAAQVGQPVAAAPKALGQRAARAAGVLTRVATVGIYRGDGVVRRATALQKHPLNRAPALRIGADDAHALGLSDGGKAEVNGVELPVLIDAAVPKGCAWIEAGFKATGSLPPHGAALAIKAVAA
ncbi:MAG TPA: NADH-quinone oxidoreductase subunit NuoG [Rhodanobacteraceae bacterium]|jgi:NADH-quinone oxidoreductase subunit G|nr:NADH-quinone oxidoreductase subunit NuoG [Rhodanobacteraceae bacterium]